MTDKLKEAIELAKIEDKSTGEFFEWRCAYQEKFGQDYEIVLLEAAQQALKSLVIIPVEELEKYRNKFDGPSEHKKCLCVSCREKSGANALIDKLIKDYGNG